MKDRAKIHLSHGYGGILCGRRYGSNAIFASRRVSKNPAEVTCAFCRRRMEEGEADAR